MSISKRPTRMPLLSNDPQQYLGPLHNSLFTNPTYFDGVNSGIAGISYSRGVFIATGRQIGFSMSLIPDGSMVSTGGTIQTPLSPVIVPTLDVVKNTTPPVHIGSATMTTTGVIRLPDFTSTDEVLVTGSLVEG